MAGSSWEDAARSMQPQFPGGAPRAANPGMGGGNRAYAPGATGGHNYSPPPGGAFSGAGGGPVPSQPPTPQPPTGQSPSGGAQMPTQPTQQSLDPMYAQRFATNLIDALMRRVQSARAQRGNQRY